jgi:Na+/phosphate symporter
MADAAPGTPTSRDPRRERLVGLLVLGVAAVLLVSSVTWFGTGQEAVGFGQLFLGLVLAVVGAVLLRRARRS